MKDVTENTSEGQIAAQQAVHRRFKPPKTSYAQYLRGYLQMRNSQPKSKVRQMLIVTTQLISPTKNIKTELVQHQSTVNRKDIKTNNQGNKAKYTKYRDQDNSSYANQMNQKIAKTHHNILKHTQTTQTAESYLRSNNIAQPIQSHKSKILAKS
jgi:hypothetical protein